MDTICGAKCEGCNFRNACHGCAETCGRPFSGTCIAAEIIKACGKEKYVDFKRNLLNEINAFLQANDIPPADALHELPGFFVNLPYPLPSGETVKFLDDKNVYLGTQIEAMDACYGVIADQLFILVCSYKANGAEPQLIAYKKR